MNDHIEDDETKYKDHFTYPQPYKKSWKMRLIEGLGLKNYLIKNFVFRPPQTGYLFEEANQLRFVPFFQNKRYDVYNPYIQLNTYILQGTSDHSKSYVPLLHLSRPIVVGQNRSPSVSGSQAPSQQQNVSFTNRSDKRFNNVFQKQKGRSKSMVDIRPLKTKSKKIKDIMKSEYQKKNQKENQLPKKKYVKPKQPLDQVPQVQQKLLVIYSHGNASDLGDVYFFADKLVKEYDVDMLIYDYTGYGLGLGKHEISEKQTYTDLQNALSFAVCHLNYHMNQIILWGFSLGSGPTTEIASRFASLGGVVLQAPLASMILWLEPKRIAPGKDEQDVYCNINKIQAIKSKIMLIHGDRDTIINIRHSQLLYEKYLQKNKHANNIWFITVANQNHNDLQEVIENADCDLGKRLFRFFREIDMERACYQLSSNAHFQPEWPPEEIQKTKAQEEIQNRETILLQLLCDDYQFTNSRLEITKTNPHLIIEDKHKPTKQLCQIKPLDDLLESSRIKSTLGSQRARHRIEEYKNLITSKIQSGKPRRRQNDSEINALDLVTKNSMKFCFCQNNPDM